MDEIEVILQQFDSRDEIKIFDKGSYETVIINNMIMGERPMSQVGNGQST
tara:strand:- start:5040 stop:5189 length:150 start_codon:yes stop_codon:yes gene_type:complete